MTHNLLKGKRGVIVGEFGLNILERDDSFELFGKVGLYYIMFLAGLEIDMQELKSNDPEGKVHLLLDFTPHPGDIADPWYTRDFQLTYSQVCEGCRALMER